MRPARAALLGALHGPAELLPVSSSAHVALLAGDLDPAERKTLEVAVHAGTGAALLWVLRADARAALRALDARRLAFHALALGLPAAAGAALEGPIEQRLGSGRALAAGLLAGSAVLAAAEAAPGGRRARSGAGAADGLALGAAQAAALVPGVSRRGATLAALRLRGFARAECEALSWEVGVPVLAAATARRAARLLRHRPGTVTAPALAAGAGAAAASTLAAAPLLRAVAERPWWPYAAYRVGLAAAVGLRSRRRVRQDGPR
jgi:undecaprenyl-diphosphatase